MISLKRAYISASAEDGQRILVDRLWPRGVSKAEARIDRWAKEIAPSTELRRWFQHDPVKWKEFQRRYKGELNDRQDVMQSIAKEAKLSTVTLVYGAKDREHNEAVVLKALLDKMQVDGPMH